MHAPPLPSEWRSGWRVAVAGAICYGTGIGVFIMTAGLFIKPMKAELGWSTSALTFASTVAMLTAIFNPLVGVLVHRWGGRLVVIVGLGLVGVGFLGLSVIPATFVGIYALIIAISIIGTMTNLVPIAQCVVGWFQKNTGSAFGVAFNGTIFVSLVSVPLVSWAIHQFGWRAGFLVLAAFTLLIGLPTAFAWLREAPRPVETVAMHPEALKGKAFSEALRDWRYWLIVVAMGLGAMASGGFLIHLQPLLADKSFGVAEAASLGVLYSIGAGIGKMGGGVLLDRFWDCAISATLFTLAGAGGLLMATITVDMSLMVVAIAVFLVALGQGLESDLVAYFPLQLFGMRAYSKILGVMATIASLGGSVGAMVAARMFDLDQNYTRAALFGGGCFLAAGTLILIMGIIERTMQLERGHAHDATIE